MSTVSKVYPQQESPMILILPTSIRHRATYALGISVLTFVFGCSAAKPESQSFLPAQLKSNNASPRTRDVSNKRDANSTIRVVDAPAWIESGGNSLEYPHETYLTGIAAIQGDDALKRAMAEAAADLANRVSVRIESELTDVNTEKNGKVDYHLAAITKLSSDVKIQGLRYEVAYRGAEVYALAYVRRTEAAEERKRLLDHALLELKGCIASARNTQTHAVARVAEDYQQCLRFVTEGLQHDAVIRTLNPKQGSEKIQRELVACLQEIRTKTTEATSRPATSLKEAADLLALSFNTRGGIPYQFRETPSFRYGVTNFASSFGQQLALHLENALTRARTGNTQSAPNNEDAVVRGVYFEEGESIRINATLVAVKTGKVIASAETTLAKAHVPDGAAVLPKNLETAMVDQRLLSQGELVDGALRVDVWSNKGRRGVVYSESEELRLFLRVNAPAFVRLIYVLESGVQVPIDQAYYIDASKVNHAVEYPGRFEIAPPFGVEHIHVTAFSKRPELLPVSTRVIGGVNYEIIADGLNSVVRHRGIKRVEKDEVAESLLAVTTLPANSSKVR